MWLTLDYAPISPNLPLCDDSLHTWAAHENGLHHQAPLRCIPGPDQTKGPLRERDVPPPRRRPSLGPARAETRVDQGLAPHKSSVSRLETFGDLIDLHITDMCEVGKPPRREPRPPRLRRSSAIWARRRSVTSTVREWLTTSEKRTVSAPKRRSTIRL